METEARVVIEVLRLAERLKSELRHSWLSSGRRESVAEHTWQMALMALVTHRHLEHPVAIDRVLRMILVHDLVEAEVGDVPAFETGERKQRKAGLGRAAIEKIPQMLDPPTGQEIYDLFMEYEAVETIEAKFAKALDNLEVQFQHNVADLSTWEEVEYQLVYTKIDRHCSHDRFLRDLCEMIKREAEHKMRGGGIDVAAVQRNIDR
jgi:5'-deoxynucleotidase YfbR-like HD superfamily hydrolase